jgi:molybdopterin biosynthesis enzyme
VTDLGILRDDPELSGSLAEAAGPRPVLTSGGVSTGEADLA